MATGQRFDAVTPRPKSDGGTFWLRVGSAWKNDKGLITIYLDAVPVGDPGKDNKIVIMLFEPRENAAGAGAKPAPAARSGSAKKDLDDEIPF